MPETHPAQTRRIAAPAVAAVLRRLAGQPAPPWLHEEIARRMAERLAVIRLQPQHIVDWWSF
ncbi:MAG TPA: biotin synthase, partial [Albitalea sp.]